MKKKMFSVIMVGLLALCMCVPAFAAEPYAYGDTPKPNSVVNFINGRPRTANGVNQEVFLMAPSTASNTRVYGKVSGKYRDWVLSPYQDHNNSSRGEYLVRLYNNRNVCLNIARDGGGLIYDAVRGSVADKVISLGAVGTNRTGIAFSRHGSPCVLTREANEVNSGCYNTKWRTPIPSSQAYNQDLQFWNCRVIG